MKQRSRVLDVVAGLGFTLLPMLSVFMMLPFAVAAQFAPASNEVAGSQALATKQADPAAVADAELNELYRRLRGALSHDTESQASLLQAQRAWLVWRDKEADLCAQAQGWSPAGSGYGQVMGKCKMRLTIERVGQLRMVLQDVMKLQ